MKKCLLNYLKVTLVAFSLIQFSSINAQNYVSQPYYEGFESGALGTEWTTSSTQTGGEVAPIQSGVYTWSGNSADAYAGNYFLAMHVTTGGVFNLNTANLHLNLTGESGLRLNFWWSDWNDETHVEDGVFISDDGGTSFVKVLDFQGGSNPDLQWVYFNMSLDSINSVHGLTFSNNYIIRFQQYDDYYLGGGNDGFLIDEVNVFLPCNTTSSITESDCQSYTVPSGDETYTSTGIYNDTIPNAAGCDSIITIDLTIKSSFASIAEVACGSYSVPSGDESYTTSGLYNDTIPNAAGCDSILTINLVVNESFSETENVTACGNYEWTDGTVYSSTGIYTQNLQSVNGCDSTVTLDLTINSSPNMSISSTNNVDLTAVGTADSIEWINCNNMTVDLVDQVNFSPSANGNYAVVGINQNGCTDTSDCFNVSTVSLEELNIDDVILYPNPAEEKVNIKGHFDISKIEIMDLTGKIVVTSEQNSITISDLSKGSYIAKIYDVSGNIVTKEFIKK
jgi:hypothetical protein